MKIHTHLGYLKKFDELKEQWGHIVTLTNKKHVDFTLMVLKPDGEYETV